MRAANVSLLAQAFPNCRALRYIDLSNNPFGNAGVTELIYMARNSNIEEINVRDCFIDNTMFSPMLLESLAQTRITAFLFDVDDIEQVFIERIRAIVEQNRGKPLIQQQGRKIKSSRRCRSCKRKIRKRT
jgi:Ran GTPase-activating protein (RanGAP) involved in mRNA processing and transport